MTGELVPGTACSWMLELVEIKMKLEFDVLIGREVGAFPVRLPERRVGALSIRVASKKMLTSFYVLEGLNNEVFS